MKFFKNINHFRYSRLGQSLEKRLILSDSTWTERFGQVRRRNKGHTKYFNISKNVDTGK